MKRLILLDTGVLGLLTVHKPSVESTACDEWLADIQTAGVASQIPPICYYEARREWERLTLRDRTADPVRCQNWLASLRRLEKLARRVGFSPIDVRTMFVAAQLWAEARHFGYQTASEDSLDSDVILAATAKRAARGGRDVHVITTNVTDLSRYVPACRWDDYPTD
jgi:toxin FitB